MTKFFAQLLLSAMIGLGAAVGFNADLKEDLAGTWAEAKAFAHETAQAMLETVASADVNVGASAEGNAEVGASANAETGVDSNVDLNLLFDKVGEAVSNIGVDGSVSAESETEAGAESNDASLNLGSKIESILGFSIGFGE